MISTKTIMKISKYVISMIAVSCFIIAVLPSRALSIKKETATTAGEFLRIGLGARAVGMGEAFGALADDVHALYWNPAGLSAVKSRQIMLSHTEWYMDVNHDYLGYVQPIGSSKGALGVSITYLGTTFEKRIGDTEAADSEGSVSDYAVGISYGRNIYWDISGGLTLKYIRSKLDIYDDSTFGLDLGLRRTCPGWEKMTIGFSITNMYGELLFVEDSVELGQEIDLGIAIKDLFAEGLNFALDGRSLINMSSLSLNTGVEYSFKINSGWYFGPRIGFKSYDSQFSGGFGVGWNVYQLDYAFVPHEYLGDNHRVSFLLKF